MFEFGLLWIFEGFLLSCERNNGMNQFPLAQFFESLYLIWIEGDCWAFLKAFFLFCSDYGEFFLLGGRKGFSFWVFLDPFIPCLVFESFVEFLLGLTIVIFICCFNRLLQKWDFICKVRYRFFRNAKDYPISSELDMSIPLIALNRSNYPKFRSLSWWPLSGSKFSLMESLFGVFHHRNLKCYQVFSVA